MKMWQWSALISLGCVLAACGGSEVDSSGTGGGAAAGTGGSAGSSGAAGSSGSSSGTNGTGGTAGTSAGTAGSAGTASTGSPFDKFYNIVSLTYEGDEVVITTKDLPDHKSPFYSADSGKYEAYNGSNPDFSTSINLMGQLSDPDIKEQNMTFRIPRNPKEATTHQATSGGAIGIAINGVVIFNQYNGVGALLDTLEFNNFDQYNGHPTPAPSQTYHYHIEPVWLTTTYGSDTLVGYLLDGFPVYGPVENGVRLSNADLDDYHGHTHATADYPDGIYHYHCTDEAPWINGDGYWGTPGTVTH